LGELHTTASYAVRWFQPKPYQTASSQMFLFCFNFKYIKPNQKIWRVFKLLRTFRLTGSQHAVIAMCWRFGKLS